MNTNEPPTYDRETQTSAFDDDGVRVEKAKGMSRQTETALIVALSMTLTTGLFAYIAVQQAGLFDELEARAE